MRVLSQSEMQVVAGNGPTKATPISATSNSNTKSTVAFNGYIITTTCTNGATITGSIGFATSGKLVDFSTQATYNAPQSCTVETLNTKTGAKSVCTDGDCKTYDAQGNRVSDISTGTDDSGFAELCSFENISMGFAIGDTSNADVWYDLPNYAESDPYYTVPAVKSAPATAMA